MNYIDVIVVGFNGIKFYKVWVKIGLICIGDGLFVDKDYLFSINMVRVMR